MDRTHLNEQALLFLAKRDSSNWTDHDEESLQNWVDCDDAHRVAFLRLENIWENVGRLKALGAGLPRGTVPPPSHWRHSPFFASENERAPRSVRQMRLWSFTAAVMILTFATGLIGYLWPRGDRYSTPIGGIASVPLQDGSSVTLNTASQIHVELTPEERHIALDRGEAFFYVAHDTTRPFVVQAGNKRVIAVGTQFSVRREADDIRVAVTEGKVRIEEDAPRRRRGARPETASPERQDQVFAAAGTIATTNSSGVNVQEKPIAEVAEDLSWRQGYLTFHNTTLAQAVEEFNRYNRQKIRVEEPRTAAIRVSGTFRATNSQAFIRILDEAYSIHAKTTDGSVTLRQN